MSLRKLGTVLVAVLALSALSASSAFGAIATEAAKWYTGSTEAGVKELTETKAITAKVGSHPVIGSKFELNGTIGTNNVPLKLTATGLECSGCTIKNAEVTGKAGKVAVGEGKIKFTSVTVDEPVNCTVSDENGVAGQVITKALTVHADWMHEGKAYQNFFPTTGTVFATLKLAGTGCSAIAGSYNVTGTVYSEAVNKTGVFKTAQNNIFSPAIQTTTGAELKLGGKKAELTGTGIFELGGQFFGIK